jgi:hypothetical protein
MTLKHKSYKINNLSRSQNRKFTPLEVLFKFFLKIVIFIKILLFKLIKSILYLFLFLLILFIIFICWCFIDYIISHLLFTVKFLNYYLDKYNDDFIIETGQYFLLSGDALVNSIIEFEKEYLYEDFFFTKDFKNDINAEFSKLVVIILSDISEFFTHIYNIVLFIHRNK